MGLFRPLLAALLAHAAIAADLAQAAAGKRIVVEYPELPSPLCGGTARIVLGLPMGFDAKRPYPLYLWYNGGGGAAGIDDTFAFADCCICLSIPLFRRTASDPPPPDMRRVWVNSGPHLDHPDWYQNWLALDVVMRDLRRVATIDPERSWVGGYSNGGHCISLLVSHQPEFCAMFKGFLFVEGGDLFVTPKPLAAAGGRELYVIAGERSYGDSLRRLIHEPCLAAGVGSTWLLEPGFGHGFDQRFAPRVREWIERRVLYAGFDARLRALQAELAARRWPEALGLYRELALAADRQRAADLAPPLAELERAAAAALARSDPERIGVEAARRAAAAWTPCPTALALRERCSAIAERDLAMLRTRAPDAAALRRFIATWQGYPAGEHARDALDAVARPGLERALVVADELHRAQALLALAAAWPETRAALEAATAADAIGERRLTAARGMRDQGAKARELEALAETMRGRQAGKEAERVLVEYGWNR